MLERPVDLPKSVFDFESKDRRLSALRKYGDFALAYSAAFQHGLDHFGYGNGFLSYKQVGTSCFALANPVAPAGELEGLLRKFVDEKEDVCFWQTSKQTADILMNLGFRVNAMGHETRIKLEGYDFNGPTKRNFRRALKNAEIDGNQVFERSVASLNGNELQIVSDRWRLTRGVKDREMTFLTRPAVLGDEVDVRKFFAFGPNRNLLAFAFFDPIYKENAIVGYLCSAKRRLPEANDLIGYAILYHAIRTFQEEGKLLLSLGLSPLSGIDGERSDNALLGFGLRTVYRSRLFNKFIYSLQGFAAHKGAFGGSTQQTYCAFKTGRTLSQLMKMPKACNVF